MSGRIDIRFDILIGVLWIGIAILSFFPYNDNSVTIALATLVIWTYIFEVWLLNKRVEE